ncbi:MAG: hypothetical protein IBX50_17725, partial [Marinospirillum sp.]|uniref:hypothetical protein n=1 Tax=Marinospirillum sp. TaxID=2183934 RepID=UPI0019E6F284
LNLGQGKERGQVLQELVPLLLAIGQRQGRRVDEHTGEARIDPLNQFDEDALRLIRFLTQQAVLPASKKRQKEQAV